MRVQVNVRMEEEDRDALKALAERMGLDLGQVVVRGIRALERLEEDGGELAVILRRLEEIEARVVAAKAGHKSDKRQVGRVKKEGEGKFVMSMEDKQELVKFYVDAKIQGLENTEIYELAKSQGVKIYPTYKSFGTNFLWNKKCQKMITDRMKEYKKG